MKAITTALLCCILMTMQARNPLFEQLKDCSDIACFHQDIRGNKPGLELFTTALEGYIEMEMNGAIKSERALITIVDFDRPSAEKRLWTIDLDQKKVLFYTYVAHGRNTGLEYADRFSNKPKSLQSSLGFYLTGNIYYGKHGRSLYLHGIERGLNDKAYERSIVMHGANYVSEDFISKHGRLGRSYGCPAVPVELSRPIIDLIQGGSCLFIRQSSAYTADLGRLLFH